MIKSYIKIAWRNMVGSPTFSLINIVGLAVGLAVSMVIGLWVNSMVNYNDYFPNKSRVVKFYQNQTFNNNIKSSTSMPIPLEKALRNDYMDHFKYLVMSSNPKNKYLSYKDIHISKEGIFMQESAPDFLHLNILSGTKNGLTDINSIMISASAAKALFKDESAIDKIIKFNNESDLVVTAVYQDIPENNDFSNMDFIAPWEKYIAQPSVAWAVDNWGDNSYRLYAELASNASLDKVSMAIKDVKKNAMEAESYNPELFLHPMKDWYLKSLFKNGVQSGGRIQLVWLFSIIGIFVLFLACINFMNLSTAKSEKRGKEVGIRKAIGSQRSQLITQFLIESFMTVLFSFGLALVFVYLSLESFNNLANAYVVFPWEESAFWIASLIFILLTSLFSGSYPALFLSSYEPVRVLKGPFKAGKFASLPRKALVVLQFTVSVTLIIGTVLIMRQIEYGKNMPIGYDKEGLVQIPVMSNDFNGKYDFMRSELLRSGAIQEMSSSSAPTTGVWSNRSGYSWEGKPDDFQEDLAYTEVSHDFAKSLNLKIVAGRDFSREMATDSNAALINETAVKYMGLENPVGSIIRSDYGGPSMTIIGVVSDMIVQSPFEPVKQAWYVFNKSDEASFYNLRLNPDQSASENISIIEGVFKKHFPAVPFDYDFVDSEYGQKFAIEEQIGNMASVFTLLAILISCLGLFGLASFMAEQRTKEIGIRKVLGASVRSLWAMLSKDFVLLVFISLAIAIPLSWHLMSLLMSRYTYRAEFAWWIFAAAGIGAISITLFTVSYQAIKAATMDPVKSLKTD
ncbi:MAG: putative ABC transport system permease protein [Arcticibacterium sp.]|jgi:putative ABC transport system permease protein